MNITSEFDTIAAIATPPGEGAIHIVRLSGEESLKIIDKVYIQGNKKLSKVDSHTIHYGHIVDPRTHQMIDEVMVTIMKAPRTYTREDVVEINCHGGITVVNKVLQLLLREGARLAEPGEFTKRAFLNGRIDLSQAEAVIDMITAKTDRSLSMAINQLDGHLSEKIKALRQEIFQTLGEVEVNIDYPEYDDVEIVTTNKLKECALSIQHQTQQLLKTASQGKILRDGLSTAIIGRPNVGKSSLLNNLLREEKAIVTDIEGTTRDVIEEYVNINGVPLKLIDTAGIRETEDIVEQIGVEKSRKALETADLILLLINQNESLTDLDKELLTLTQSMNRLVILNKIDLEENVDKLELQQYLNENETLYPISVYNHEGIDEIGDEISQRFFNGDLEENQEMYLSNTRHIHILEQVLDSMSEVLNGIDMGMPVDLVQIDMVNSWNLLGEIIGETVQDELLNELFSNFCLGK